MADITMPQLGETVTEGTITKWLKQVGDRVEEDEVLYEVSTDKVDSEVPSPAAGYLAEIVVQEGETVDVGAKLAVISDQPAGGESDQADQPPAAGAGAGESSEDDGADAIDQADGGPTDVADVEPTEPEAVDASGEPPAEADQGADSSRPAPAAPRSTSGSAGAGTRPPDTRPGGRDAGSAKILSPVVRRLIAENNLDPSQIDGTGAGGRITRADVLALVDHRGGSDGASDGPSASGSGAPAPAPAPVASAVPPGERDEVVPFSNIRRRTAEHMVRSLATSAHTLVAIEVDYENVERVRRAQKERFKATEGISLSYLPFIARALVDAIGEFPHVNASIGDSSLIVHRYVNLGIAVDLNYEGLIVPVVHDAETKRMRALAREIAELAVRARSKKLGADEIAGGTFTITNAGGYGTLLTGPIINQPQVAILSTDGVKPQPVAVALPGGGYGVAVHSVGNLAISFDHRAYDGAYASAFLARVKETLETRDWSQEL